LRKKLRCGRWRVKGVKEWIARRDGERTEGWGWEVGGDRRQAKKKGKNGRPEK